MPLRVRVTCAGVEIGTAELRAPNGLAHERLVTGPHYAIAFDAARRCALALSHTQHWSPRNGDFAAYFAEQWEGGRLGLEDELARVEAFLSAAAHAQKNKCANAACGHHSNASVTRSVRRQHPMLRSSGTTAPHAVPKPADISRLY